MKAQGGNSPAELQAQKDLQERLAAEARAIAAPDSWPWPMSKDAKEWVERVLKASHCDHEFMPYYEGIEKCRRCHEVRREQFNHEAHERFLKSLG